MKCIKLKCTNEAIPGRTCCSECLTPYFSNGVMVNPPDVSESTYKEMNEFFSKALRSKNLR